MNRDWTTLYQAWGVCTDIPLSDVHPYSMGLLGAWYRDPVRYMEEFLRTFNYANSDYTGIAQCVAQVYLTMISGGGTPI